MHSVIQDDVEFDINNEGTLVGMRSKKKSVFIPKKVKGVTIQAVGSRFCKDYTDYDKIVFDDSIDVINSSAFEGVNVKEVVWPSACKDIPFHCFYDASILKMSNINNVSVIGTGAFEGADIKEFVWPTNCRRIPSRCFSRSNLKKISNIDNILEIGECAFSSTKLESLVLPSGVESIGPYAFLCSSIKRLSWPKSCSAIPHHCFSACHCLEEIDIPDCVDSIGESAFASCGVKKVRWPDACKAIPNGCFDMSYIEEVTNISNIVEIGANAFSESQLKRLDLSALPVCLIGDHAFVNVERDSVSFPYYLNESEIDNYF